MSTATCPSSSPQPFAQTEPGWADVLSEDAIDKADESALIEACQELAQQTQPALPGAQMAALAPQLHALLEHANYKVGAAAISALVAHQVHDEATLTALVETTASDSLVLQWKAVNALGRLAVASDVVIDALVARLHDDNGNVRRASIKALGQLAKSDQRAGLALLEHMHENEIDLFRLIRPMLEDVNVTNAAVFFRLINQANTELKTELISWLIKHTDLGQPGQLAEVLDFLQGLLEEGDYGVKQEACRQLRGIQYDGHDTSHLAPTLLNLLQQQAPEELRSHVLWTLKAQTLTSEQCTEILRRVQENGSNDQLTYAIECAERIADAPPAPQLVIQILKLLSHPYYAIRLRTLSFIKRVVDKYPITRPRISAMLGGTNRDESHEVRCKLIEILDGIGEDSDTYIEGLRTSITSGATEEIQLALLAAGNLQDASVLFDEVASCLRLHEVELVEHATLAIAHMGPGVVSPLIHMLDEPDEQLRSRVEAALEALGTDCIDALLAGLQTTGLEYSKNTGLEYRIDCAYTCATLAPLLSSAPLLQGLLEGLRDGNDWVRRYCAEALGQLPDAPAEAAEALASLLDDPAWDVRAAAAEALAAPSFNEAVVPLAPKLIELLDAPESDVRSAAVIALDGCADKQPAVNAALLDVATHDPTWYVRRLAADILSL